MHVSPGGHEPAQIGNTPPHASNVVVLLVVVVVDDVVEPGATVDVVLVPGTTVVVVGSPHGEAPSTANRSATQSVNAVTAASTDVASSLV